MNPALAALHYTLTPKQVRVDPALASRNAQDVLDRQGFRQEKVRQPLFAPPPAGMETTITATIRPAALTDAELDAVAAALEKMGVKPESVIDVKAESVA